MTRTFRYALTAVLSLVVVIPAMAQDNFPDVPDNHWAYDALKRMKSEGLLVGYPDGLFRGNRPATRYELAVAVHATYVHLRNMRHGGTLWGESEGEGHGATFYFRLPPISSKVFGLQAMLRIQPRLPMGQEE